jgi:uncharacterized protein (DUF2267 family)
MTTTGLDVFDKAVQKTNLWLKELRQILMESDLRLYDLRRTFGALDAVLRALRDRLMVGEAFDLGAQLPMILRGFYFDGWDPRQPPSRERSLEEFLERVRARLTDAEAPAERLVRGVFSLLARRVSEGEIEDVRGRLPAPLRELWPDGKASPRAAAPAVRAFPARPWRARARKARKEIRATLARARAEGVPERDLPVLMSRTGWRRKGGRGGTGRARR